MVCKYFLPVCSLSFHSINKVFYRAKFQNFDEVQVISFFFYGFGVKSKNSLPLTLDPKDFLLFFFSKKSMVLHFIFKSVVYFKLIFKINLFIYGCVGSSLLCVGFL